MNKHSDNLLLVGAEIVQIDDYIKSWKLKVNQNNKDPFVVLGSEDSGCFEQLHSLASNQSLFGSSTKVILRMHKAPTKAQLAVLCESVANSLLKLLLVFYCKDSMTLRNATNSAWLKTLKQSFQTQIFLAMNVSQQQAWLKQKSNQLSYELDEATSNFLVNFYTGNTLAMCKHLEVLALTKEVKTPLDRDDKGTFTAFDLLDAVFNQNILSCSRILKILKQKDPNSIPLLIWSFKDALAQLLRYNSTSALTAAKIFPQAKKTKIIKLSKRVSRDQAIVVMKMLAVCEKIFKGQANGDCWIVLQDCCYVLCGKLKQPGKRPLFSNERHELVN